MTQKERSIRGAIAWRLAAVGDAITGLAHGILDEIPAVETMFEDGRQVGEYAASSRLMEFVRLGYDAGVHAGLSAPGSEPGR